MNDIETAKMLVKKIYGDHCTYNSIFMKRYSCDEDYEISHGCFRATIIPEAGNFVIKTGLSRSGTVQCIRESRIYTKAKDEKLEKYFAAYIGEFQYHKHRFFLFEKIDKVGAGYSFCHPCKKLEKFLKENNINDLHFGNYGYKNRLKVLTDYSGVTDAEYRLIR